MPEVRAFGWPWPLPLAILSAGYLAATSFAIDQDWCSGCPVYAARRLDSANRRYLQAIKTLASTRKLLKPDTFVDLASRFNGKQIKQPSRPRKMLQTVGK